MQDEIKSIEQRVNQLFSITNKIANEANPYRDKQWKRHEMSSILRIKNPKFIKAECYYLFEVYLKEDLQDKMWDILEGFSMWLDTFQSGRTSLKAMIEVFTPENLEKILSKHEENAKLLVRAKKEFLLAK